MQLLYRPVLVSFFSNSDVRQDSAARDCQGSHICRNPRQAGGQDQGIIIRDSALFDTLQVWKQRKMFRDSIVGTYEGKFFNHAMDIFRSRFNNDNQKVGWSALLCFSV